MGRCEYCKKNSKVYKNLSYFVFPKDEAAKFQWVKNMGRKNWTPGPNSRLCADHFVKECIDTRNKMNRLHRGAIPTVFAHLQESNPMLHINMRFVLASAQEPLEPNGNEQRSQGSDRIETPLPAPKNVQNQGDIMRGVNHDHRYHETFDTQKQKLNDALKKITKLSMKNQRLKESQRRAQKTISTLKDLLSDLRKDQHLAEGLYTFRIT